jgi:transcription termination factor Rho
MTDQSLNLSDLKAQSPKALLAMAEELEIENASTMRKGEMMFQILRERADEGWNIGGDGCLQTFLNDPNRIDGIRGVRQIQLHMVFLAAAPGAFLGKRLA